MTDYQIRVLEPAEYRQAHGMSRVSLHRQPAADEDWSRVEPSYEPGRTYGAVVDGEIIGSAQSYASQLAVPGGKLVPAALVSRVGVRADHTRRGVLTSLMRGQLEELAEPLAALHASEAVIYGRFGYGVASQARNLSISKPRAILRAGAPAGGRVRMLAADEAWKVLPELYTRLGPHYSGWVHRPDHLWDNYRGWYKDHNTYPLSVVHTGADGDDGYLMYFVKETDDRATLEVADWFSTNPESLAGLFRYLLSVDLVDDIKIWNRPLDEPLEWLLTDYRAAKTEEIEDDTWLRLVDVQESLSARIYNGPGSVVIDVRDAFLPTNSGHYEISADGAVRVDTAAQLALDVEDLAAIYLGGVKPSTLAQAGRVQVLSAAALPVADSLFATPELPWMNTGF